VYVTRKKRKGLPITNGEPFFISGIEETRCPALSGAWKNSIR